MSLYHKERCGLWGAEDREGLGPTHSAPRGCVAPLSPPVSMSLCLLCPSPVSLSHPWGTECWRARERVGTSSPAHACVMHTVHKRV